MNAGQVLRLGCLLCVPLLSQTHTAQAQSVIKIASTVVHSLYLKSDGSLWAAGGNKEGQLGNGTCENVRSPERIVPSGVVSVAVGNYRSFFLKNDGSVWGMGDNAAGLLGDGTFDSTNRPVQIVCGGVTAIAAGENFTLLLKSDGSLWAFGDNLHGELGDGTRGTTCMRPKQVVAGGVRAISAGGAHSLFIKNDGTLWGMGNNTYGQLGDGRTYLVSNVPVNGTVLTDALSAIRVGWDHTCALLTSGGIRCWGNNGYGQLGNGGTSMSLLPVVVLGFP